MPPPGAGRRLFDLWSRTYDDPLAQAIVYRPVQDAVLRALREGAPARVLDVGCGTGLLTRRVADELGAVAIGCDFSRGMLQRAAPRARPGVAWVQGDALALPVASGAVHAVVCTESFHWYPDQGAALRELARVTAPGGRVLLALVNARCVPVSQLVHRWSSLAGQPFRWPTAPQVRALAGQAGLAVVRQTTVRRRPGVPLLPAVLTVLERPGPDR
ncbi:MAG: methyltransferase domain-containing protein [Acidimicrobiales bacterium]|nr:methyltransferase domain-containing protein [Acidimicrobiales bacterium]